MAEETFKGLSKEQFDEFAKKQNEGIEAIKKDIDAKGQSIDAIDKKYDDLHTNLATFIGKDSFDKQQEQLDEISTRIKQLKESQFGSGPAKNIVKEWFYSEDGKKAVADFKSKKVKDLTFELKANTLTEALSITDDTTNDVRVIAPERDAGIVIPPRPALTIFDICAKQPTNNRLISYTERSAETNGVGMVAQDAGSTTNKSDISWTQMSVDLKKIMGHAKVPRDMIDDWDTIRAEINEALTFHCGATRESGLLTGDGTGNNLKGFVGSAPWATAFSAPTILSGNVSEANYRDALRASMLQVRKGDDTTLRTGYMPNYIVISPDVASAMDLEKASDGHYIMPPFVSANNMLIKGIPVVESDFIDDDTFLVGDFRLANLRIRRGIEIRMWEQNEDDALNDLVTFTVVQRMVLFVKNHHKKAFVYGTFTNALAALNKVIA